MAMLVDPPSWDIRPESLRNTTETLGTLSFDRPVPLASGPDVAVPRR